jgi:hypothetical protein
MFSLFSKINYVLHRRYALDDYALDGSQLRVDDEHELCTIPCAVNEDSASMILKMSIASWFFHCEDTQPVPDHSDMDSMPATQSQVDLTQRISKLLHSQSWRNITTDTVKSTNEYSIVLASH